MKMLTLSNKVIFFTFPNVSNVKSKHFSACFVNTSQKQCAAVKTWLIKQRKLFALI